MHVLSSVSSRAAVRGMANHVSWLLWECGRRWSEMCMAWHLIGRSVLLEAVIEIKGINEREASSSVAGGQTFAPVPGMRGKKRPRPTVPTNLPSRTATSPRTVTMVGRPSISRPSKAL